MSSRRRMNSPLLQKGGWSLLILFVFLLGRQIPLPGVNPHAVVESHFTGTNRMVMTLTGGDLNQLSIFTLGVTPWMTAMIIMMVLSKSKRLGLENQPKRVRDGLEFGMTILFAGVQSFVTVNGIALTTGEPLFKSGDMVVLVTGAVFSMWLSKLNGHYGIGGLFLLVIAGIIQSMAVNLLAATSLVESAHWGLFLIILVALVGLVAFAWVSVLMDRAELRVPVVHIMTTSSYSSQSYLPIKLAPAGGMPLMFAFAFMSVPLYLLQFLAHFWPHSPAIRWGIKNSQLTSFGGVTLYCLIIFGLSLMFARINVDPDQQAENLQHQGDYLPGHLPGKPTARYLRRVVDRVGLVGAVYLTALAGLPMYLGVGNPRMAQVMLIPGIIMMVIGFGLSMIDQVNTLRVQQRYRSLL